MSDILPKMTPEEVLQHEFVDLPESGTVTGDYSGQGGNFVEGSLDKVPSGYDGKSKPPKILGSIGGEGSRYRV
jgi:hypothetical protein